MKFFKISFRPYCDCYFAIVRRCQEAHFYEDKSKMWGKKLSGYKEFIKLFGSENSHLNWETYLSDDERCEIFKGEKQDIEIEFWSHSSGFKLFMRWKYCADIIVKIKAV